MKEFKNNISKIYGKPGEIWLERLEQIIEILQNRWELSEVDPVPNMSYNFVAKVLDRAGQPAILKIGYDKNDIGNEIKWLNQLTGRGIVNLLQVDYEYNALLLQRAIPGVTLKSLYPDQIEYVMETYVQVVQKLHNPSLHNVHQFQFVDSWLDAIDNAIKIPQDLLHPAIRIKDHLLKTLKNEKILHGDLHLCNILSHNNEWLYGPGLEWTLNDLDLFFQEKGEFQHWLAYENEIPFAYLLTSPVIYSPEDELAQFASEKGSTISLDIIIGNTNYLGKGLCHTMIQEFLLSQFSETDEVLIDPDASNTRAIHVYQKAGFHILGEFLPKKNPIPHCMLKLKIKDLKA